MNLQPSWSAYPLRAQPLFRDYLWGGRKLQSRLGKQLPPHGVWAESWEFIDHDEHQSLVTNGQLAGKTLREIAALDAQWLLGTAANAADGLVGLPLLLKYLDCQRVLSVQVHPDDAYAREMSPPDLGKTEAWYVVDAEAGAVLYAGLKPGVTQNVLRKAIENACVEECLHVLYPQVGDCLLIPSGTVHALGAGLLIAEIQQASNTTFRLYDWNRLDANGQARTLHIDQALEVIDFQSQPRGFQVPALTERPGRMRLVECEKFILDRLDGGAEHEIGGDDRFHLLTAPQGGVELWSANGEPATHLAVGESVLIPAAMQNLQAQLSPQAVLLDMYLP